MFLVNLLLLTMTVLERGVDAFTPRAYRTLHLLQALSSSTRRSSSTTTTTGTNGDTRAKSKPSIVIEYCTGCRWLLRSAYYAQELLTTFEADLDRVALKPNSDKPGGVFTVTVLLKSATAADNDDEVATVVWDRRAAATPGFPETKNLKQKVRDAIAPAMDLGHSDRALLLELPPEQPE